MKEAKRAVINVRVSIAEQETDFQESELKEYCERRAGVSSDMQNAHEKVVRLVLPRA